MKRFIVLLLVCCLGAAVTARPIRGTVKCAGTPPSGVTVTDGHSFTESGADGTFTLDADDDALFISIVTPSGYLAPMEQDIPQFFRPYAASTKRYDFELRPWPATGEVYELLAIGDPQPKTAAHFDRLRTEIIPELQRATALGKQRGTAQAALLLGDIVWDSPELFAGVREQFASLGIPVYGVIGNHDHDRNKYTDREATENYRNHFGPTYYAFDMGRTHYIVLDDIVYHGAKKYDEQIDSLQLAWAAEYARRLPAGSRVCVAMHAPALKAWKGNQVMESAARLMDAFAGHELHFITGHTHVNSNYDIREGVVEHNVAQICGNLWYDPINKDGTPKGYQLFRECGGEFSWEYRSLGSPAVRQLRVWQARAGGSVSRKRRGQNLELGPLLDRRLVRGRPLPRRNAAHPDRRPRLCGASRLSEKRRAETRQIAASPHLGLLFQSASFGFGTDDRGSRHGPFRTPLFGAHHARKGPMTGRSGDS